MTYTPNELHMLLRKSVKGYSMSMNEFKAYLGGKYDKKIHRFTQDQVHEIIDDIFQKFYK